MRVARIVRSGAVIGGEAMRLLTLGIAIGLVFGLAAVSTAGYVSGGVWARAAPQSDFRLGYVAGIVDAIETLRGASFITREQLSEALAKIETCAATDQLAPLTARAEAAVAPRPAESNAAAVIMTDLLKCQ